VDGQDGAILPARDYELCPSRTIFPQAKAGSSKSIVVINLLLTKLAWSRWLDIGVILLLGVLRPQLHLGP